MKAAMGKMWGVAAVCALAVSMGCAAEPELGSTTAALGRVDDLAPPGAPSTSLNVTNPPGGIMQNGLDLDDLLANGFVDPSPDALQALVAASLYAGDGLPPAAQLPLVQHALHRAPAQRLLRHIVECALPDGTSATFVSDAGWQLQIWGVAGVAPEWAADRGARCDTTCQRRVSACLFETVNDANRHEVISMRWPQAQSPAPVPAHERQVFYGAESTAYGNYFDPWSGAPVSLPEESNYPLDMHLCLRDVFAEQTDLPRFLERLCGADHLALCQRIVLGRCGDTLRCPKPGRGGSGATPVVTKACAYGPDENGAMSGCVDHATAQGIADACRVGVEARRMDTASVYRSDRCPMVDFQASAAPMPSDCSPCVQLVGALLPACTSTAWSEECVDLARQRCAGQDLLARTTVPFDRGSADVIDRVCAGAPECCASAWGESCVAAAKPFYP
jgi:hypothetical protein